MGEDLNLRMLVKADIKERAEIALESLERPMPVKSFLDELSKIGIGMRTFRYMRQKGLMREVQEPGLKRIGREGGNGYYTNHGTFYVFKKGAEESYAVDFLTRTAGMDTRSLGAYMMHNFPKDVKSLVLELLRDRRYSELVGDGNCNISCELIGGRWHAEPYALKVSSSWKVRKFHKTSLFD